MLALSHFAAGLLVGTLFVTFIKHKWVKQNWFVFILLSGIVAMLPDLDMLFPPYHSTLTHSFWFVLILGLASFLILKNAWYGLVQGSAHIALDVLEGNAIWVFWPWHTIELWAKPVMETRVMLDAVVGGAIILLTIVLWFYFAKNKKLK